MNKLAYCLFGNLFFCNLGRDIKALGLFFLKTTKQILYLFNQSFVSFPFVQDMVHLKKTKNTAGLCDNLSSELFLIIFTLAVYLLVVHNWKVSHRPPDLCTSVRGAPGLFPGSVPSPILVNKSFTRLCVAPHRESTPHTFWPAAHFGSGCSALKKSLGCIER